jgi:hypothetical protein
VAFSFNATESLDEFFYFCRTHSKRLRINSNELMKKMLLMMSMAGLIASCSINKQETATLIGKQPLTIDNGIMTPEVMWAMGRLSDIQVSPDGHKLLYGVS